MIPKRMKKLYRRLAELGLNELYVRKVSFPIGWSDEDTQNPAVYSQALSLLATNLNIDIASLQDDNTNLKWNASASHYFRKNSGISVPDLEIAKNLALNAACIVTDSLSKPFVPAGRSGSLIRRAILNSGSPNVGFSALLDYCWGSGIPVLHLSVFPNKCKKPSGIACLVNNRPAIVIIMNSKYPAWLLFILAHELGHIAKGHLDQHPILIDNDIDRDDNDRLEIEATNFAVDLLTGNSNTTYNSEHSFTGATLARESKKTSLRDEVDAGFIALNYAKTKSDSSKKNSYFALGNSALQIIEPESNPVEAIRRKMCKQLDWDEIGRDNSHFIRQISGMKES